MEPQTKFVRIFCGVTVAGGGVYAHIMIPVDQDVCPDCLGIGKDYDTDEKCDRCDGGGTVVTSTPEE